MKRIEILFPLLLLVTVSASRKYNGQLHIVCSDTQGCIRDKGPLDIHLPTSGVKYGRSVHESDEAGLTAESQKLQDEINVVQDVESVMEDELKTLHKHTPSKTIHAEEKELKSELDVMEGLESDLVAKENAVEKELEEVESSDTDAEEYEDSYDEGYSEDESTEENESEPNDETEASEYSEYTDNYDYTDDSEFEYTDKEGYRRRRSVDHHRHRLPNHKSKEPFKQARHHIEYEQHHHTHKPHETIDTTPDATDLQNGIDSHRSHSRGENLHSPDRLKEMELVKELQSVVNKVKKELIEFETEQEVVSPPLHKAQHFKHQHKEHSNRVPRSTSEDEPNIVEELTAETQKLQDEVNVVQDVESVMEDEIETLEEQTPSKAHHDEEKELKNELNVMKELETDLVAKEDATERELEEVESDFDINPDETDEDESEYHTDTSDTNEYDYAYYDHYGEDRDSRHRQRRFLGAWRRLLQMHKQPRKMYYVRNYKLNPLNKHGLHHNKGKELKKHTPLNWKKSYHNRRLPHPHVGGKYAHHLVNITKNPNEIFVEHHHTAKYDNRPSVDIGGTKDEVVDGLLNALTSPKTSKHKVISAPTAKKVKTSSEANFLKQLEKKVLDLLNKAKAKSLTPHEAKKLKVEIKELERKETKAIWELARTKKYKKRMDEYKKRLSLRSKLLATLRELDKKSSNKKTKRSSENLSPLFGGATDLHESKTHSEMKQAIKGPTSTSQRSRRSTHKVESKDDRFSHDEELSAESQKLKEEINIVQNVEEDMEEELNDLEEQRPSKLVHTEEKDLKHKLAAMKDVESDLIADEDAIEQQMDEDSKSDSEVDFDQSYDEGDEMEDTDVSDYEELEGEEFDSNDEYSEGDEYSYDDDEEDQEEYRWKRKVASREKTIKLCNRHRKVGGPTRNLVRLQKFCNKFLKKVNRHKQNRPQKHHSVKATHPVHPANKHNNKRCQRCEEKVGEEVCGANGKTYNSLCHAVNCAGLRGNDIKAGPCSEKDVCTNNGCANDQLCVPMTNGVCLALYRKTSSKKLPCRQYLCVAKDRKCTSSEFSQVCGVNGKTYPSLCFLHKAGVQMAYTGACRPKVCKGSVCGQDGTTYKSSCHARARSVRIDYSGECFAEKLDIDLRSCSDVRKAGRCVDAPCRKPVIPEGACCPVCGGAAVIHPDYGALSSLVSHWEEVNHLYVVENFLRKLLSQKTVEKCELTTTLTDTGNISIVLAAVKPEEHKVCQSGVKELVKTINEHPASLKDSMLGPVAKTAAMVNPFNPMGSVTGYVTNMQNKAMRKGKESMRNAKNKYNSKLKQMDEKAALMEDQRELERSSSPTLRVGIITFILMLVFPALL